MSNVNGNINVFTTVNPKLALSFVIVNLIKSVLCPFEKMFLQEENM